MLVFVSIIYIYIYTHVYHTAIYLYAVSSCIYDSASVWVCLNIGYPQKSPKLWTHVPVKWPTKMVYTTFSGTLRLSCRLRSEILASYAWQMCSGLAYLHYHYIVHRVGWLFFGGTREGWGVRNSVCFFDVVWVK